MGARAIVLLGMQHMFKFGDIMLYENLFEKLWLDICEDKRTRIDLKGQIANHSRKMLLWDGNIYREKSITNNDGSFMPFLNCNLSNKPPILQVYKESMIASICVLASISA